MIFIQPVKRLAIIFGVLFFSGNASAQSPEELLNRWGQQSPIEKIYLHFDREYYVAGETAWFKAYLWSDYQPDTISSSLYVELLDASSNTVGRVVLPVIFGSTYGQIELPDSLYTGYYLLRAWTPTMLNHSPDFISQRRLFVYGKQTPQISSIQAGIRMDFFPEGGNLIGGTNNTIAFKATNEKGLPVEVSGVIKKGDGEVVTQFSTYHDGMGMFDLQPAKGEKYQAILSGNGTRVYELPEITEKGIALTMMPHPDGFFFELKSPGAEPQFQPAYMVGQMQHHLVFKQVFGAAQSERQGVINTRQLYSGILQVTIFNKQGQPLAERLCFINNKEYIQRGEIRADTIDFSAKARNKISIQLADTVQGSFSVSVIEEDYSFPGGREQHIYSGLLLTSDIKGYVHRPAWYFSGDNDSVKTALDLVMMTNGWRRFRWEELPTKVSAANSYTDGSFITLAGKVNLRDTKKPLAGKTLLLMIMAADSTRSIQMTATDQQGYFKVDSLLFYGNTRVLFSEAKGKKSQYIDVLLSADSLHRNFVLPVPAAGSSLAGAIPATLPGDRMQAEYEAILKASGQMLEGITVKVKKKTALEEMEERYTNGLFSGGDATKTIDLVNNKEAEPYANIFDYLQYKIQGLRVVTDGPEYTLFYRQAATISSLGLIPMTLFLDEVETDASFISTIPANQIALVKLFSHFAGASGNGAGGVLALYTRKGADMSDVLQYPSDIEKYKGYSVIREFYSPDYKTDRSAIAQADSRITLQWKPDIRIRGVNPVIPVVFYNNDRTKACRVIVEGVTDDGKLLMLEKLIQKKAF